MDPHYKKMTDFLLSLGSEQVAHSGKSYLAHVIGVFRLMESQGCSEELCRAGMFHSVYGTQSFQHFKLPLERRPELRVLIGERAERLAYLNCAMGRESLDEAVKRGAEPFCILDRLTGEEVSLTSDDFDDLCRIHLYDWLEQVPRSRFGWDYRRRAYRGMAERLGRVAVEAYDRVFAQEHRASPVA
jgi:hypothetical protein